MRLLLLTLIILLFASPVIMEKIQSARHKAGEIALFFDLSASMTSHDFKRYIRDAADKILDEHPGSRFALIASTNTVAKSMPLGTPLEEITGYIDQLTPSLLTGDHYNSLLELEKLFGSDNHAKRKVFIFSDLQQHDWTPSRLPSLNIDAEFEFIRPEHSGGSNIAIVNLLPEIFIKGNTRRLRTTVQVHNFSITPATATLKLKAGESFTTRDIKLRGQVK